MALAERAALHVLARKPNRMAIVEQRGEGQRFGRRPIDALALCDDLLAVVEKALNGAVGVEVRRHCGQLLAQILERLRSSTPVTPRRGPSTLGELDVLPGAVEPVGLVGAIVLAGLELAFETGAPVGLDLVDLRPGQDAFFDQLVGVDIERRLVARIALYISGWVKLGSSPSLWPKRR